MSHVVQIDLQILDLAALKQACEQIGLEFLEGQKTYKWYGRHVGDFPLPKGFAASDMGKCDHAIGVKGKAGAYQVGVCKRRDGQPGYTFLFDFFAGGHGLIDVIGKDCGLLTQEYAAQVATKQARKQGFQVKRIQGQDGKVLLKCIG